MKKKKLNLNLRIIPLKLSKREFVNCAVSGREIPLDKLTYWNVDLQEAYFSPKEVNERYKRFEKNYNFPSIMCPNPLIRVFNNIFSKHYLNSLKSRNLLLK